MDTNRSKSPPVRIGGIALSAGLLLAAMLVTHPLLSQTPLESPDGGDAFADARPAAGSPAESAGPRTPPPAIPTELAAILIAGGPVMIPIGLCSFVALAYGLERVVMLRRRRVIPRDFVSRFIEHLEQGKLDRKEALKLCEANQSPVADVFAHGVRKWGKPSVEVEQAIIDGGERQVSQLRKHLRVLNAVYTVTPLLGLFGTVIGMIMCFNQIANSSAIGKSEQLAGGIGVALITTAAGLAVAIPSILLYMYLVGRVDALVTEMDLLAQRVVNLISAEGLANPPVIPQRPAVKTKPPQPAPAADAKEPREAKKPVMG